MELTSLGYTILIIKVSANSKGGVSTGASADVTGPDMSLKALTGHGNL
jgi:hypothetical protein